MKKAPDMVGEIKVKKHIEITKPLDELLDQEAWKITGGNVSWLIRMILRERYGIAEKD